MLLFCKQCFSFPCVCLFCRICWTHLVNEDSKLWSSRVKYSSERVQINQSFCIKQQQKLLLSCMRARRWHIIYFWSEGALSFIHHIWRVLATPFWLGQINCVWGSLHVLAAEYCVLDLVSVFLWSGLNLNHIVFQTRDGLD